MAQGFLPTPPAYGRDPTHDDVAHHEVVARAYPGQDGREQQPEQFEHAFSIADFVRVRFSRPTTAGTRAWRSSTVGVLVGRTARREVWSEIHRWIDAHERVSGAHPASQHAAERSASRGVATN